MDPNSVKVVTHNNITSEDVKPEGRIDGPKNFGPEFVSKPDGTVVATRPSEQIERQARAVAEDARANGQDEHKVAEAFASMVPEGITATPATAQMVPSVTPASMNARDRKEHEENTKDNTSRSDYEGTDLLQYDRGTQFATQHRAKPFGSSDAFNAGYDETREAMEKEFSRQQDAKREANRGDTEQTRAEAQSSAPAPQGTASTTTAASPQPTAGSTTTASGGVSAVQATSPDPKPEGVTSTGTTDAATTAQPAGTI